MLQTNLVPPKTTFKELQDCLSAIKAKEIEFISVDDLSYEDQDVISIIFTDDYVLEIGLGDYHIWDSIDIPKDLVSVEDAGYYIENFHTSEIEGIGENKYNSLMLILYLSNQFEKKELKFTWNLL